MLTSTKTFFAMFFYVGLTLMLHAADDRSPSACSDHFWVFENGGRTYGIVQHRQARFGSAEWRVTYICYGAGALCVPLPASFVVAGMFALPTLGGILLWNSRSKRKRKR